MDLLHFARGLGLKMAIVIFCLGVTWRIVSFALLRIRREYSRPRESMLKYLLGGLITVGSRSWPHREFIGRTGAGEALGYSYHLGLFAVVLLFTPHILFLQSLFGFSWPGLPSSLITIISVLTLTLFLAVLFRRVTNRVMRLLSNFDDYFSWFITMLVMVTGLAATAHIGGRYETLLALHILSVDVLLIWFPFGKLMHAFYIFPSRRHQWRAPRPERSNLVNDTAVKSPATGPNVAGAMKGFAQEIGALSAFRLESCIHCGICADACHYYIATEDPQYTPIWKVEPFKQAYKRESSALAPLYRLFGFKREVTADQLAQWQHLLFDSCNMCGSCSLICPMGIDVAALIEQSRHAMFEAGLAPKELYEKAAHQQLTGQPESSLEPYRDQLLAIGIRFGVEIPLDKPQADVMLCVPRTDIEQYPSAVAALARVMSNLGISCTFRSDGLVAENYGYFAGAKEWQRDISLRLIEQAIACGANTLLLPECGHAYTALRWVAADLYGKALPFRVLSVTEFLADELKAGRLKLAKAADSKVTFHDPCQLVRKGGVNDAPRELLKAMSVELEEMENHGGFSFCCNGGGGVIDIKQAAPLRYRVMEVKMREIDATGAPTLLTSCSDCRRTFDDAQVHFNWDKKPNSLLELVAGNLLEAGAGR